MWRAYPVGWLARRYRVEERGRSVGTIEYGCWSERGAIELEGRRLSIRREGLWHPTFRLHEREFQAHARSAGFFRRGFYLVSAEEEYRLDPASALGRTFELTQRERFLGQIRPLGLFSRKVQIELDDELPPVVRLFAFWLFLLARRRAVAAS